MSVAPEFRPFGSLSGREVHDLLKLRFDVFVLEQKSLYPEIDGLDPEALHGLRREGTEIVGACRLTGLGGDGPVNLGRVAIRADRRGGGAGRTLILAALAEAEARAPGRRLEIEAQAHLRGFYEGFGFARTPRAEYMDGGIPHVDMTLVLPGAA